MHSQLRTTARALEHCLQSTYLLIRYQNGSDYDDYERTDLQAVPAGSYGSPGSQRCVRVHPADRVIDHPAGKEKALLAPSGMIEVVRRQRDGCARRNPGRTAPWQPMCSTCSLSSGCWSSGDVSPLSTAEEAALSARQGLSVQLCYVATRSALSAFAHITQDLGWVARDCGGAAMHTLSRHICKLKWVWRLARWHPLPVSLQRTWRCGLLLTVRPAAPAGDRA